MSIVKRIKESKKLKALLVLVLVLSTIGSVVALILVQKDVGGGAEIFQEGDFLLWQDVGLTVPLNSFDLGRLERNVGELEQLFYLEYIGDASVYLYAVITKNDSFWQDMKILYWNGGGWTDISAAVPASFQIMSNGEVVDLKLIYNPNPTAPSESTNFTISLITADSAP